MGDPALLCFMHFSSGSALWVNQIDLVQSPSSISRLLGQDSLICEQDFIVARHF